MTEPPSESQPQPQPQQPPAERGLQHLPPRILDEVIRQFRAARNDILRYGVWNVRNLTDELYIPRSNSDVTGRIAAPRHFEVTISKVWAAN